MQKQKAMLSRLSSPRLTSSVITLKWIPEQVILLYTSSSVWKIPVLSQVFVKQFDNVVCCSWAILVLVESVLDDTKRSVFV